MTAYHPESNGALECLHRTLTEYPRHYINADQIDWDEWLPYAILTYNIPHTTTEYTSFELVYGHQATSVLFNPTKPSYTYDDYAQELRKRLRTTNQIAKENLKEEKQRVIEYYDKKKIKFKVC